MPSFLVTRRMSPALAARVLDGVRGPRRAAARRRTFTGLLRIVTLALLAAAVAGAVHVRARSARAIEQERASLLDKVDAAAKTLTTGDWEAYARVAPLLAAQAVAAYPGDFLGDQLRDEARLADALAEPTLYVRGPLESLADPAKLAAPALESDRDAFVLCLIDPPKARTEQALKAKARAAYARGKSMQVTGHVERFAALMLALPLLEPGWRTRAAQADDRASLRRLEQAFSAAPVPAALRAAKARQVMAVMDEPGAPGAVTELDGERPHPVRALLVDLTSGAVRFRVRRDVDPSWISPSARAELARGIDSCGLALDVREALLAP